MSASESTTSDRVPASATIEATFCATLVDEWVRSGVTTAFVACDPRANPVAVALAGHPAMSVQLFHDERSAGFAALGHGLRSSVPAIALCVDTAANLHGPLVEADRSAVPLVAVTTNQPWERRPAESVQPDGQPQLHGSSVRFKVTPGVPDEGSKSTWRSVGSRVILEASGWSGRPGPVHLSLKFRDTRTGSPDQLPPGRSSGAPWHQAPTKPPAMLADPPQLAGRSGVIIAGNGTEGPNAVLSLADALGWPVLADHQSGCRAPGTIVHFDALLRSPAFVDGLSPDVILRFGEPLASRSLSRWLAGLDAEFVSIVPDGRWLDPEGRADVIINDDKAVLSLLAAADGEPTRDVDVWRWIDALAADAIETTLEDEAALTEPAIARELVGGITSGSALLLSSSRPIEDVEHYAPQRDDIEVYSQVGAGGAVATAIGLASTRIPTTLLLDDGALVRDSTSLIGLGERPLDLTIVVLDRGDGDSGTGRESDIEALAKAHGLVVHRWGQATQSWDRVRVVLASVDHTDNRTLREQLNSAVLGAVTPALESANWNS